MLFGVFCVSITFTERPSVEHFRTLSNSQCLVETLTAQLGSRWDIYVVCH